MKTTLISHDHLIRPLLKEHVNQEVQGRLADEMNVQDARIDLAVIADALHGYEIKAENDSLCRFLSQRYSYETAFDYLTLVTTLKKADKIRDELPPFWGLLVACEKEGVVEFWEVKKASLNPRKHATGVLNLLWREEILGFPAQPGWARGIRGSTSKMRDRIQQNFDLPTINAYVRQCLKERPDSWRYPNGTPINVS